MKKIFLLISLIAVSYCKCYCQNSDSTGNKITESEFTTGENGWSAYLKKHINYDIAIFNDAPRGKYITKIQFTIFEDGHLGEFKALTKFGYGMEREVLMALKKSPDWKPAMQDGKPVKSTRVQIVTFAVERL